MFRKIFRIFCIAIIILLNVTNQVKANNDNELLYEEETLETIASAARHEVFFSQEPGTLSTISSKEIEIINPEDVCSILRYLPGILVTYSTAGFGEVFLRGGTGAFAPILVLIDGRPIYLELLGMPIWPFLTVLPEEIEKIELIRSPTSVQFGSHALTGAINIVTKSAEEEKDNIVKTAIGTQNYKQASIMIRKHKGTWHLNSVLAYEKTEGFETSSTGLEKTSGRLSLAKLTNKGTFRLAVGLYLGRAQNVFINFDNQDLQINFDGKEIYYGNFRASFEGQTWFTTISSFFEGGKVVSREHSFINGQYIQESHMIEIHKFLYLPHQRLNIGAMTNYLIIKSDRLDDANQFKYAIFGEDYIDLPHNFSLLLGARLNYHPIGGYIFLPRGSLIWKATPHLSLRYTYAKSFGDPIVFFTHINAEKLPLENFYITVIGKKDLKYISQESHEFALSFNYNKFDFVCSFFQYRLKNLPTLSSNLVFNLTGPEILVTTSYQEKIINGFDIENKIEINKHLNLRSSYEYTKIEDEKLKRRTRSFPEHLASLLLIYDRDKLSFFTGINYISKREWEYTSLDDITYVDCGINYTIKKHLTLTLKAINLLNNRTKNYPTGENLAARYFLKLKYAW